MLICYLSNTVPDIIGVNKGKRRQTFSTMKEPALYRGDTITKADEILKECTEYEFKIHKIS